MDPWLTHSNYWIQIFKLPILTLFCDWNFAPVNFYLNKKKTENNILDRVLVELNSIPSQKERFIMTAVSLNEDKSTKILN